MKHKDEDFNVTLCEWVEQMLDDIEEELTAQWLEEVEVKQAVENVLYFGLALI